MKKLVLAALCCAAPIAAQPVVRDDGSSIFQGAPVQIKLDAVPINQLATMLMRDVMKVPYVISAEVLKDARPVSVNLSLVRRDLPVRVVRFLRSIGLSVQLQGGTVYVSKGEASSAVAAMYPPNALGSPLSASVPSGSPLSQSSPGASYVPPQPLQDGDVLAYVPSSRDVAYLAQVLQPLFPTVTFGAREQLKAQPSEQAIAPEEPSDVLLMVGPKRDLATIRGAIAALDRPRPLVAVKAVVMQLTNSESRGSALAVLAKIAGGKIEAGAFVGTSGPQYARLSVGSIDAVLSAVREDNRFKVVASPNLAALSGSVATINAGSQVPTLGAVAVDNGVSTQSVVYRNSGITLEVRPTVRGGLIHLDVKQERSNFVPTTTGVDDSPTLQTASVSAQATLKPGESVALAGLTENSAGHRREGIFGGLLGIRSRESAASELIVMLQADLVPTAEAAPGVFTDLSATPARGEKGA